jgi:hypothetical protein
VFSGGEGVSLPVFAEKLRSTVSLINREPWPARENRQKNRVDGSQRVGTSDYEKRGRFPLTEREESGRNTESKTQLSGCIAEIVAEFFIKIRRGPARVR